MSVPTTRNPAPFEARGKITAGGLAIFADPQPPPYSGRLRAIVADGMIVRFLHWGGPCTDPGRHFATLADVDRAGIGPEVTLAAIMRRPCRVCGSRRWVVDIAEPAPDPVFGHGGT